MEFVDGGSLDCLLRQGPLPLEKTLAIIIALCQALDYAHARGVIHRDIKPHNIMFDQNGRPVLTDFGIARAMEESSFTVTGANSRKRHRPPAIVWQKHGSKTTSGMRACILETPVT